METFKLTGYVFPLNRYDISGVNFPSVEYKIPTIDETIKCNFQIEKSQVTVICEVAQYHEEYLGFYINYVTDFTRVITNLLSFSLGDFLDIFFDEVEVHDKKMKLVRAEPRLRQLCTTFKPNNDRFLSAMQIVMKEPNLFLALADVISVLRDGTNDISACYRAIERLRNLIPSLPQGKKSNDKKEWEKFSEKLQIPKDFIDYITNMVGGYRHGHLRVLTPEERSEILHRTWIIMNHFIAYRMGDTKPLKHGGYSV